MRTRYAAVPGGLVLLGLVSSGAAVAAGPAHEQKGRHAQELTLHAQETSSVHITRTGQVVGDDGDPEAAPAVGDRLLIVDTLYSDEARATEVGRNDISCEVAEFTGEFPEEEPAEGEEPPAFSMRLLCSGVVSLDEQGDVAWHGAVTLTPELYEGVARGEPLITVAITGGTGPFQKAGGQVSIYELEGQTEDAPPVTRYEVTLYDLKAQRSWSH